MTKLTPKDRNLIKGALRRVFSRSALRLAALEATRIQHVDPSRPRVKKWSLCKLCNAITPTYLIEIDHIQPLVPVDKTLEAMSWDEIISRLWCDLDNLQGICLICHDKKCKLEREQRKAFKKEKKR